MTIILDPQLAPVLRQKVDDGLYRTTDEALNEAVRLLDARDRRLKHVRSLLAVGLEQAERGELIDLTPELLDEIDREVEAASSTFRLGTAKTTSNWPSGDGRGHGRTPAAPPLG